MAIYGLGNCCAREGWVGGWGGGLWGSEGRGVMHRGGIVIYKRVVRFVVVVVGRYTC